MSKLYPPPECLSKPLNIPDRLLMGPGPANVSPSVLQANSLSLLGHMHPEFFKIMDEVKAGLQYAFQTKNEMTICISGSGHAAMETACCNLVEEGDVVLVIIDGLWGKRFADMSDRHGADVRRLEKPLGNTFTLDEIEEALDHHRPAILFATQGESTSATLQPLEGVGELCHRYNCLLVVDAVASLGGVPLFVDKWEIDCCYTGSQKTLCSPPGVAPITFGPGAREKLQKRRSRVRSFYFDMNKLGNYWGVPGCGGARKYHHTAPIQTIYAIREGLALMAKEGLENRWARTRRLWEYMQTELEKMGLKLFVKDKAARLPTVTALEVPHGIDWKLLLSHIMNKYQVEIGGGLGPSVGKMLRIGLMGTNATEENINRTLQALDAGIRYCRNHPSAKL